MPREPSPACSAGGESPSAGACLQGDEPMRRCPQVLLILGLCLSVPAAAHAACAPTPIDDCSSARPAADFFALRARCQAKAAAERAAATPTGAAVTPAAQSVCAARNTVASLNFANVPTWTDADILAQFASTRDKRYITDSFDASPNPRRITWMYPQDGCFDRAEQVDDWWPRPARSGPTSCSRSATARSCAPTRTTTRAASSRGRSMSSPS